MVRHAFVSLGLSLALVCGCATQATDGEPSDEPVAESADAPVEGITDTGAHVICRTERHTGSRVPRRVCRTSAQIEEERRDAEEVLRRTRGGATRPGDR